MQNTYIWNIIPTTPPTVLRSCPRCKCSCEYESSGNFRVNANQNHIDVWLIYQCKKCNYTWNMEILSRVNPNTIEKELYQKLLRNDKELARRYAFDVAAHGRNKSVLCYDKISYDIIGNNIPISELKEAVRIKLVCDYPLDIRLDKIISKQLGISREQVKRLGSSGSISGDNIKDIGKAKVKNGMLLSINTVS